MPYFEFLWTRENARHIAEHGVSTDDFEAIVQHSTNRGFCRRSLLPVAWGVYEHIDEVTVNPITAYEVPEPR
jgi:hypothetical protein